ncbi:MAG: hypothetical protein KC413_07925, partial [Anaerolineales bacterium]|nr:hypothetical protein [Anaerolineales bacterium]
DHRRRPFHYLTRRNLRRQLCRQDLNRHGCIVGGQGISRQVLITPHLRILTFPDYTFSRNHDAFPGF